MAAKPHALSTVPPEPPADTDYDAICAAVTATARGRWFLEEYAKRNRNSDTLAGAGRHRPHGDGGRWRPRAAGEPRGPSRGPHRAPRNGADDRADARRGGREPAPTIAASRPQRLRAPRRHRISPPRPSGCGRSHGRCEPAASTSPLPTRSGRSQTLSCRPMRCVASANSGRRSSPRHCTISSIVSTGCSTAIWRWRTAQMPNLPRNLQRQRRTPTIARHRR